MKIKEIESFISKVQDYPKPGILFYDISTLISNNTAFRASIDLLHKSIMKYEFDLVAGIDARGFIFASALAYKLNKGIVMIRKKNKLPGNKMTLEYDLEYGKDTLEVNIKMDAKKIEVKQEFKESQKSLPQKGARKRKQSVDAKSTKKRNGMEHFQNQ